MSVSIDFIRPLDKALTDLKKIIMSLGIAIHSEERINNGKGIKLRGVSDRESVSLILYLNKNKGISSKVIFERFPVEKKEIFIKNIGASQIIKSKSIQINATVTIADNHIRSAIKSSLANGDIAFVELETSGHIDYRAKLSYDKHELTLTQFSSGALLVQGIYSSLVDKVIDVIEFHKPLTLKERALFFLPEDSPNQLKDEITEDLDQSHKKVLGFESQSEGWFTFLFENDKKTFNTGEALLDLLENYSTILPEYNFLVAIYAKVFEGFIIKLMINKGFFTIERYKQNPDIADIGNAIRKQKFSKYIMDSRRYGFISEKLIAVWEGSRCKEMHSDPIADQNIISVKNLQEARDKVGEIKSCIKDAYEILVRLGNSDSDFKISASVKMKHSEDIFEEKELPSTIIEGYIGTDESGKGDYFGPLIVAGVFLDPEMEEKLSKAGIRDSKKISDNKIHEYAKIIRTYLNINQYSVIQIGPEKYNELYSEIRNLNKLLAWGHARAIENILININCSKAIADQFGDKSFIENALMKKGKNIDLIQRPKAEQFTAVAAASVLARESFLNRIEDLKKKYNIEIIKGASDKVELVAKQLIEKYGISELNKLVKVHFKTTEKIKKIILK